jgi:hypothetical protein
MKTGTCSVCGAVGPIHDHHPNYMHLNQTVQVCPSCHVAIHEGSLRPDLRPRITRREASAVRHLREALRPDIEWRVGDFTTKLVDTGTELTPDLEARVRDVATTVSLEAYVWYVWREDPTAFQREAPCPAP